MSVQAGRDSRRGEKARGPFARLLLGLTLAACLLTAATMCYGIYNFPDAPLRQTAGGYAGKHGGARTREDYERFVAWEKAMLVAFPAVFVLAFAFALADAGRRAKRDGVEVEGHGSALARTRSSNQFGKESIMPIATIHLILSCTASALSPQSGRERAWLNGTWGGDGLSDRHRQTWTLRSRSWATVTR